MPRKRDIEAAVAAYNDAAQALLLPPSATRLLIVMFPRGAVCQRSLDDLAAEGFDRRGLPRLLRGLVETGFLSKEPGSGRVPTTYTLHPPGSAMKLGPAVRQFGPSAVSLDRNAKARIAAYSRLGPPTPPAGTQRGARAVPPGRSGRSAVGVSQRLLGGAFQLRAIAGVRLCPLHRR